MSMVLPLVSLALLFSAPALPAHPNDVPTVLLGVAWYPEQWPEERWDQDLALMNGAGIRLVRIGEFAWSSMEPQEGYYELDWVERAIAKAAAHHIFVVLGTPTDAPPAWLTRRYPETLRVDETGKGAEHGERRQFSYTSPRYRELAHQIVEQLARRFGRNPNVIGWQIGNEYTYDSYDDYSRRLFHEWLKAKYKTLASLNQHWTTAYWSQTYDLWDGIPLPGAHGNPGLMLDYRRFVTDQWRAFQRSQIHAIRRYADATQFITTNLGGLGWAARFNRREITADLDLISWDDYVGQGHLDPYLNGATHDLVWGWKRQNFWVMEAQPGSVNWAPISNTLDKGETRTLAWEAIGHGADCVAFWQWRSALNGQEQYHGTVVGPDGEPVPLYEEVRQIGREFAKLAPVLKGTTPVSEVAILHDYDSRWAINFQKQSQRYDQINVLLGYYRPLRDLAQSVDMVDPRFSLDRYKLVVAPSLNVISASLAQHLLEYVQRGGHLVLGPRSGMKDEFNALNIQRQPGPLTAPLGGRVEQFYALVDDVPVSGQWGNGTAMIWAEQLSPKANDTSVVMRYGTSNGWLDGQPAVLTRHVGQGSISYIGAVLDPKLMRAAARWMVELAQVRPAFGPVPEGVEVCRRVGQEHRVYLLINHARQDAEVTLPRPMYDELGNAGVVTQIQLPAFQVAILSDKR
jgi:beta-galactosidase